MRHAKLFSILVVSTLALYAIAGLYTLPLAGFEGGLSRMSMLPESQFGWTKPQPAIPPELLRQSSWQEADILVIGDSFSIGDPLSNTRPYLWQSVLTQHGLRVHTENWGSIRAICEDFGPWLKSKGFKGKYVIIEMVERGAEGNLDKSIKCPQMAYRSAPYPTPSPPDIVVDRQHANYSGKLSVGLRVQLHAWEYAYLSNTPDFRRWDLPNNVRLERLSNGCELFSHRQCRDIPFLNEDRIQDFDENMFSKMARIEARLSGFTPVWVIVPDKSTTYLNPNKTFWDRASQRLHAPNLLATFRQSVKNKTVDLYRGNDSHLSTEGFLIMGEAVRQSLPRP
jgi:hypothetical protein